MAHFQHSHRAMNEFDLIKNHFAPLAKDFSGSLNLTDDAAIITPPVGCDLVVTKDAMCEGVHFIGHEDAALIAQKLLRVNLSDLAAMGATPLAYLLSLQLPKNTTSDWIKRFANGLLRDQNTFSIHLAGGDTTSNLGPLSCSITAFGTVKTGNALKRSGAKIGDSIYVSGTLGDSALGLKCLLEKHSNPFLEDRYFLPQPRMELGTSLVGIASSAMDISDGLIQDVGHICTASNVGAIIHRELLPLSKAAASMVKNDPNLWEAIYAGGDDYELLFTASDPITINGITRIGEIVSGADVLLKDYENIIAVTRKGFAHF
jgi:thiamine-monophosphate kinase